MMTSVSEIQVVREEELLPKLETVAGIVDYAHSITLKSYHPDPDGGFTGTILYLSLSIYDCLFMIFLYLSFLSIRSVCQPIIHTTTHRFIQDCHRRWRHESENARSLIARQRSDAGCPDSEDQW